ncbi:MAG: hypothetical protein AB8I08_09690 [Sandaracinaceae bacterium]
MLLLAPSAAYAQDAEESSAATPADAEADDEGNTARARELFAQGVDLSTRGRWAPAAARFEEALALRDAPAIRYNLAVALHELGRDLEANTQLDAMAADPETTADLAARSDELRPQILRMLGRLTIERGPEVADAAVRLDERALDEAALRGPVTVTAGAHVISAERDGSEVARTEVSVLAGERTHVLLGLTHSDDEAEGGALHEQWYFWAAIGGGAVLLAVVIGASVAVATSSQDGGQLVEGNFSPGVLTW